MLDEEQKPQNPQPEPQNSPEPEKVRERLDDPELDRFRKRSERIIEKKES
jgi:hypothetical protein